MLYAGYQYDAETGLYYLNARMYDSKTARFIQEDTYRGNKTDPLSLNLYTYCANNPLKYEDPTGHNFIKSALSKGAKAVKKAAKSAVKVVKKVAKAAKTVAKKVVSAVKYVVKTVVKYVTKAVKYVANKVQQFWNSPGETVQSVISDAQRALEEKQRALEAKIQAYQQSDTMKFALTATAVDNSMDASEKSGILDMLGDFVDAKLNDLSGLASSAVDFAVNNKSFMIHSTLDVVGLLPGIGNFADGLNAVVYLLEGDMGNVAWSLAACLPLAGVAAVGVKYTGKAADATITFFKNSDKLNGFLDTGKTALKKTGDFFGDFFAGVKRVLNDNGGYMDLDAILHPVKAHKALKAKNVPVDELATSSSNPVDFIVTPKGESVPVPKGATGPVDVVNSSGNTTGFAFTGGTGGTNGQVYTVRIMDPTPPRGKSPGYPDGYVKYENINGQGVDPKTGRTISNSDSHFPLR